MNDLEKYLKNKRIVIVGPGTSIFESSKNGRLIDSYDVVCRLKKCYPIEPLHYKYLGTRTDILISHLKTSSNNYNQNNFELYDSELFNKLKYICHPFPYIHPFDKFYNNFKDKYKNIKTPVIMDDNCNNFNYLKENLNNYTPTTFLQSLLFFLKFDIKKILIIGITFQLDTFISTYKTKEEVINCLNRTKNIHNIYNEYLLFKKLKNIHTKIKINSVLEKHLKNNYSEEEFYNIINNIIND